MFRKIGGNGNRKSESNSDRELRHRVHRTVSQPNAVPHTHDQYITMGERNRIICKDDVLNKGLKYLSKSRDK